jgi:hypothetical protein
MSFYSLPVYSKVYMEVENEDWTAIPTTSLLHRIHQAHQSSIRWIAVLHYKEKEYRIALGDPVRDTSQVLFVPQWFLHQMNVIGDGEHMEVSFERAETLPKATRLRFSIIGNNNNIPDGIEVRDLLEGPLSQLGVLEKNQIIPIPVLDHHKLKVEVCEPADLVFLDGNDVAFEIEEPPVPSPPPSRQPTPFTTPITTNTNIFDGPMISTITGAQPRTSSQRNNRVFIPFQGSGRTLSEM